VRKKEKRKVQNVQYYLDCLGYLDCLVYFVLFRFYLDCFAYLVFN
jgi:hypothetical protein